MTRDRAGTAWQAAAVVTVAHNWLVHRRLPQQAYVPANLTFASVLIMLARWGGTSWNDLGLKPQGLARGVRAGMAMAGVPVVGVVAALADPRTRGMFADERIAGLDTRRAIYEIMVRIPCGTALPEEIAFRGALLGLALQRRTWWPAVWRTSAMFGLWHIPPALPRAQNHTQRASPTTSNALASVAASVVTTTIGGIIFALLRRMSGSVATPVIVHASINAATFYAVLLRSRRSPC